jgi:hypothetical protein
LKSTAEQTHVRPWNPGPGLLLPADYVTMTDDERMQAVGVIAELLEHLQSRKTAPAECGGSDGDGS